MITAKVIADSISPEGKRITSLQLHYPKFIHGEFMTHRVFSRNASSSRAIPFEKMLADIKEDMAEPIHWGKNQPGMQAREEIEKKESAETFWRFAAEHAISEARSLYSLGVHKQIVNRLLEPFYNINVLVTATEWDNFFELRCHPDAQPEIQELAWQMKNAMAESKPEKLKYGEWHLPYIQTNWDDPACTECLSIDYPDSEYRELIDMQIKISVARCARVSYMTHEGKPPSVDNDLKLYDRLVGSKPLHASPAEHQARPREMGKDSFELTGNFRGWVQYRKVLEDKSLKNQ